MNEFLCYENGGKITKASRAKTENNCDPASKGATIKHFLNSVLENKQMLWLMIREIKKRISFTKNVSVAENVKAHYLRIFSSVIIQILILTQPVLTGLQRAKTWFP